MQPDPHAPPLVEFTIAGAPYMVLNVGPEFTHSPAASISILTKNQDETDTLWEALIDGGAEGQCGWRKDRFGVWWQILRAAMTRMLADPDRESAGRVETLADGGYASRQIENFRHSLSISSNLPSNS